MRLEVNKNYHGFTLLEQQSVSELKSTAYIFEHDKSGAKLLFLENEDDNRVFAITFRTPPQDSTGLPHILEHSVLCGSRKYPLKEPFVELAKGSLNTFLNAFTFSDKTMYPVASRNEQDFHNLMDVYLDAVFYPNIEKYPEILQQEGWHYHLEDPSEEITYKGVVYNEMKGAFSSPESILFRKIQESLFPDTPYAKESGGDPEFIPDLTQEQFVAFHKKYYHPSNSYIYLYGKVDIEQQLKFLNEEYLQRFSRIDPDSELPLQRPFDKPKELIIEYPIAQNEKEEDKTFFSMNFAVGKATNAELVLAFTILEYMLLETPAAPLKRALIEADLGKDVFGSWDHQILQPSLSVVIKNSNEDKKEQFEQVLFATLEKLAREGLDKKLIEAAINRVEFQLREGDTRSYPKGLIYAINCMNSWLYDASPILHLQYEPLLAKIKTAMTSTYFERLIREYLLHNNHRTLMILRPKKGLAEAKEKEVAQKLAEYKASLSEAEIASIVEQTKVLQRRQNTPDTDEALQSIPLLELKDIQPQAEKMPLDKQDIEGITVLHYPIFTNGIAYVNMYFDTSGVAQEDLQYIGLLAGVLGNVSTEQYSYEELSNEIDLYTGGFTYSAETFADRHDEQQFLPKLVVKSKALVDKLPKLFELGLEVLKQSRFDDKKRMREILLEMKSRMEMRFFDVGHVVAASRLLSYFSPVSKYNDTIRGLSFYKFITECTKDFDARAEEISTKLEQIARIIFQKPNLLVSFTADANDLAEFRTQFPVFVEKLGNVRTQQMQYELDLQALNEGLLSSAKVQYVAKAYNFKRLCHTYTGSLQVLRTILSLDYLWNRVRVQGGAYGCLAGFERNGNVYFSSYRDPNLKETIDVYKEAADYVQSFDGNEREMRKYIIGTISRLDTPLTPSMKGERATNHYLTNLTYEEIQQERAEVLATTQEHIRACAPIIADTMQQNYICTLGNEEKIKQNKELFNHLVDLFD